MSGPSPDTFPRVVKAKLEEFKDIFRGNNENVSSFRSFSMILNTL